MAVPPFFTGILISWCFGIFLRVFVPGDFPGLSMGRFNPISVRRASTFSQTALYRAMEKNLAENAANVYIQDMADFVAVRDGLEGPSFYPIYVLDLSTIHYTK